MTSLALLLAACFAGPALVVGLAAVGVPWQITAALVAAVGLVVLWRAVQQIRAIGYQRLSWPPLLALLLVLGAATFYTARLSVFMLDVTRSETSVFPARKFFCTHSCLSAYVEAARLAPTGANIFDVEQYSDPARPGQNAARSIGPLEVDLYQYPPAFLILPRTAIAIGLDFFTIRRVWFAIQNLTLLAAVIIVARWIGGASGLLALLFAPVIWLAPTTRLTMQIGNFQPTAFALTMVGMVAFERARTIPGAVALAFATVSKIYPGILGIVLLGQRRFRAIGWTIGASAALTAIAWAWLGSTPFVDFVRYQLPRIQSGQAFFWIDGPEMAPVNYGVHGLIIKLRTLGVPLTGPAAANLAASLYGLVIVGIAVLAAARLRLIAAATMQVDRCRLRQAQVWLALLNLASFRSPFVPDAYALIGTLWLVTLVAAEGHWKTRGRIGLTAAAALSMIVLDGGPITTPVPAWILLSTLGLQLAAIAFNVAIAITPGRAAANPARTSAPSGSGAALSQPVAAG